MIVGMVTTYQEGPLAVSAVQSLLPACQSVQVFEGPIAGAPADMGSPTDWRPLRKNPRVSIRAGKWATEAEQRNAMLAVTRRYTPPVWGVFLAADEILIDAQYVPDLIYAAGVSTEEGRDPVSIPLLITEVDGSVGRVHRIFRLDRLVRHVVSMSQFLFDGSDMVTTLPLLPVWKPGEPMTATNRPPLPGEPHVHHRQHYRGVRRNEFRLHRLELDEAEAMENAELARLGLRRDERGRIPLQRPNPVPGLLLPDYIAEDYET